MREREGAEENRDLVAVKVGFELVGFSVEEKNRLS